MSFSFHEKARPHLLIILEKTYLIQCQNWFKIQVVWNSSRMIRNGSDKPYGDRGGS